MGTTTLSTRRTYLAHLLGIHGTIQTSISTMIDNAIAHALRRIYAYHTWPWLESSWRVELEAQYDTGTISCDVSADATAITGSGTSFPTGWTATYARLRTAGEEYGVSTIDSATGLTTSDSILADLSGAAFNLFIDRFVVGTDVEQIQSASLMNQASSRLQYKPPAWFDEKRNTDFAVGHPEYWTTRGLDGSSDYIIEVYPIPAFNEILHVRGIKDPTIPTADGNTDEVPDRFTHVVDLIAEEYLWAAKKDQVAYAMAAQRAETELRKMVQQSDLNQGPNAIQLDPRVHVAHNRLTEDTLTTD